MKYFGTDGIRGTWKNFPLQVEFLEKLSLAISQVMCPRVLVIGRDTRKSGTEIKDVLIRAFPGDIKIIDVGIVSSPLLSRSVVDFQADLGIMITASHNPASDNGVKIFDQFGNKITESLEREIEKIIDQLQSVTLSDKAVVSEDIEGKYFLPQEVRERFAKVVVDCANGSAVKFAKHSYQFPQTIWIGDAPDGENINDHCGSEYPKNLAEKVKQSGAALGIAHDGDGDRVLLCDQNGNIIPGEAILGLIAIYLKRQNKLNQDTIVTTPMSNRGLSQSLEKYGIRVELSDVGDRNVAEKMRLLGCNLGGENSGHIIFTDKAPTSDGIQTALLFLQALVDLDIMPSDVEKMIQLLPKKTLNIRVREKVPLDEVPEVNNVIQNELKNLGDRGKIFVRYSGTELKLRILVEATTEEFAGKIIKNIKNSIVNCNKII